MSERVWFRWLGGFVIALCLTSVAHAATRWGEGSAATAAAACLNAQHDAAKDLKISNIISFDMCACTETMANDPKWSCLVQVTYNEK